MDKSGKEPESENNFLLMNSGITANEKHQPTDRFFQSPNTSRANQDFCRQRSDFAQQVEAMQPGEAGGGETSLGINMKHQTSDDSFPRAAVADGARGESCYWLCATIQPTNGGTAR